MGVSSAPVSDVPAFSEAVSFSCSCEGSASTSKSKWNGGFPYNWTTEMMPSSNCGKQLLVYYYWNLWTAQAKSTSGHFCPQGSHFYRITKFNDFSWHFQDLFPQISRYHFAFFQCGLYRSTIPSLPKLLYRKWGYLRSNLGLALMRLMFPKF